MASKNIKLVTYAGSIVTPQDDALIHETAIPKSGKPLKRRIIRSILLQDMELCAAENSQFRSVMFRCS